MYKSLQSLATVKKHTYFMTRLEYARVSAKDQNPDRQIKKFRQLEIDERYIFIDKQSGKDFNRPQYQEMEIRLI